ncbi:unnamed protein product [Rotaria sordida]|uniref:Uncharacterized protein n=1 Tax=Rotaria sordida TaxID=392033 RepID=A0A814BEL5_9BILA|nr:unnamed protein product [Rotaria sordida]
MTSKEEPRDNNSLSSSSTATRLKYTIKERACKTVSKPLVHRLDIEDLFSNPSNFNDKPNLDVLKQHILLEGRLTEQAALRIIETVSAMFID